MKKLILATAVSLMAYGSAVAKEPQKLYENNPDSWVNYEVPEWYADAKFGFWPIWGIYSVPAFKGDHAAEWYGRWMYNHENQGHQLNNGYATHLHHREKYGDPSEFGYKDFIPMWKGENFDADQWAKLAKKAGAKFFCMIGVFSDNFALWDSEVTPWNSVDMGPKRDIVAEMSVASKKQGLKFGVSNHQWGYQFFMWNHLHNYDVKDTLTNPDLKSLYGAPNIDPRIDPDDTWKEGDTKATYLKRTNDYVTPSEYDLDLWEKTTMELADKYSPDLYYFDWCMNTTAHTPARNRFITHYYNQAIKEGKGEFGAPGVVINYKGWVYPRGSAVYDHERGRENDIKPMVWQTDDSVYDGNNWSYSENEGVVIRPANELIDELIDVVSKNGVLMLAFGPKADGTFPDDQVELIGKMGSWLKEYGEAIYATRPWKVCNETITTSDNREVIVSYTRSKDEKTVYPIFQDWSYEDVVLTEFKDVKNIEKVSLIGSRGKVKWSVDSKGLKIVMPKKPAADYAYAFKVELY